MSKVIIDAVYTHDIDRLAKLLAGGEDPNAPFEPGYNYSSLDGAVGALQLDSAREAPEAIDAVVLLLRYGADVSRWDEPPTTTPLLTAVKDNQIEAVRLLLAAGADPNIDNYVGESPLRLCVEDGRIEMARLLLCCGAAKTIDESGGDAGLNALGMAVTRLNLEMVKLLLAHGADPTVRCADRVTPGFHLSYLEVPDEPGGQERFDEIRRLVGDG